MMERIPVSIEIVNLDVLLIFFLIGLSELDGDMYHNGEKFFTAIAHFGSRCACIATPFVPLPFVGIVASNLHTASWTPEPQMRKVSVTRQ